MATTDDRPRASRLPTGRPLLGAAWIGLGMACAAPISTLRSPMHPRIIELHNDTSHKWLLTIEPTTEAELRAATTFAGRLRPGETKVLYLYHGFRYRVNVLEGNGHLVTTGIYRVDQDMGLVFGGESLKPTAQLVVELGEPVMTFVDSLPP